MKNHFARICTLAMGLFVALGLLPHLEAAMSASLNASVPSPSPVGTMVTWSANVTGASPGTLWYRFRSRLVGAGFQMVRDYGPVSTLDWTASGLEGIYEVELAVRNRDTGETVVTSAQYQITSRMTGATPLINPTSNPLVFLYSAPPCPAGGQMSVEFVSPDGYVQSTPAKPCVAGLSMNFYLAGLRANSQYTVKHTVQAGANSVDGPVMTIATPSVSLQMPSYTVMQPPQQPVAEGILLQTAILNYQLTLATDLSGNLVWYYPGTVSFITRPVPGGFFFGVYEDPTLDSSYQILREFDLAGTTLLETNAARVSEQLASMGRRGINSFHHEATLLPDGKILTLASTEQIMSGIQGTASVDVLGDMILVLDQNLQVVWTWDAFDHLDPHRLPTLGETCTPIGGGCPPFYQAPQAIDWLHGNSLQLTPDGNILYSVRHQDWLIKIAFKNGQGNGGILWRLGKDGDFSITSTDPSPWFSHQHDAGFVPGDNTTLAVFDDGNVRRATDPNAHSRGQVLRLDEQTRIATLVLNADMGAYSYALGSAQRLSNGNYHFNVGIIQGTTDTSQSVEVNPGGQVAYAIQVSTPNYRTFRMRDLYAMPTVITASAASYRVSAAAPESIVSSFGQGLAVASQAASTLPLPTAIEGAAVKIKDSAGVEQLAPLIYVSPAQINYVVPSGTALGPAAVTVVNGTLVSATGTLQVGQIAPGLFSANSNGKGVAAAVAVTIKADGSQSAQYVFTPTAAIGSRTSVPVDLGGPTDQVNLMLPGTGFRGASGLAGFSATIGGVAAQVLANGPDPDFPGVDWANVQIPRSLAGHGDSDIVLTVDGVAANTVTVNIK